MKLRNKRTGDIWEFDEGFSMKASQETAERAGARGSVLTCFASSLAKLNEEWEDVPEEPKEYWYIDYDGGILCGEKDNSSAERMMISMGNHFESLEEAEKAVEKLKAWKRLKDKGLTFCAWKITDDMCSVDVETTLDAEVVRVQQKYITDDLNLLFGGEE